MQEAPPEVFHGGTFTPFHGVSQEMDAQSIWNIIEGAMLAALGWAARTMYEAIRALEKDLADHKQVVARDYVTNAELERIEDKLDRILERLPK